jgi:hypothetical protein
MGRTVQEIMVSGRNMQEVKDEIHRWMQAQGLKPQEDREDFIKCRLGSGAITARKYFEIFLKPKENGVLVRTEGWISALGAEQEFDKGAILGGIPRRDGWKVMEHLWGVLKAMSK